MLQDWGYDFKAKHPALSVGGVLGKWGKNEGIVKQDGDEWHLLTDEMSTSRLRAVALLTLILSGCSPLLVKGPAYVPPAQPIHCTESRAVPWIDGAAAGFAFLAGAVFLLADHYERDVFGGLADYEGVNLTVAGVTLGAGGAGLTWSAVHGHREVSKCQEAKLAAKLREVHWPRQPSDTIKP